MNEVLNVQAKHLQSSLIDSDFILDDGVAGAGAGYTASSVGQVDSVDAYAIAWEGNLDDTTPVRNFYVWLQIISTDRTDDDETYFLTIEESDTSNFASIRKSTEIQLTHQDLSVATAILNGLLVVGFTPSFKYFRAYYTLAGTTPILKVGKCWATPIANN